MDVTTQVKKTHDWISKQLEIIQHVDNELFRQLLLVTMIDSFAQHHSKYDRNNVQTHFAEFLYKYGEQRWPFLNQVCCVTLFNQYSEQLLAANLVLRIVESTLPTADNPVLKSEAEKLVLFLAEQGVSEQKIQKHTYANLIYAMRNKLSHELTNPGCPNYYDQFEKQIPFVAHEHEIYFNEGENKKKIRPKCRHLHIPEQFLVDLLLEVKNNYLHDCLNNNVAPFAYNSYSRKFRTAWYDE